MTNLILSDLIASVSELKKHPMQVFNQAKGKPIAILNRNKPVFYCISPKMFEALVERIEEAELVEIIHAREGESEISINIDDL
jgi:antitoxin StbD